MRIGTCNSHAPSICVAVSHRYVITRTSIIAMSSLQRAGQFMGWTPAAMAIAFDISMHRLGSSVLSTAGPLSPGVL